MGTRIVGEKIFKQDDNPKVHGKLDNFFQYTTDDIVYKGFVDDNRNTDNAWMETIAINFHDKDDLLDSLALTCRAEACWAELRDQDLFGSHRQLLKIVANKHNAS